MTRSARGFTLIELLAVAALVALVAAIVLPRIGIGGDRRTLGEGEQLAASVEFARQRAAVTGTPHRVLLDLDLQAYRVESWRTEEDPETDAEEEAPNPADRDWAAARELPLRPPEEGQRAWRPVSNLLGDATRLPEGIAVTAIEGRDGLAQEGRHFLFFDADGSGDGARIELSDRDGNQVTLEVAPLADAVRLAWGGLRERRGG
jgi:type II secretion system protein H